MECRLDHAPCPGPTCPFWVRDECLLAEVDLAGRDQLAAYLKGVRDDLVDMTPEGHALRAALAEGTE